MLSLEKLDELLLNNGIFPNNYFSINNIILYTDCVVSVTAQKFILQIPIEYKLMVPRDQSEYKIFNLKPFLFHINDQQVDVVNKYKTDSFDELDYKNMYGNESMSNDANSLLNIYKSNDISTQLMRNYNFNIDSNMVHKDDIQDVRDIYQQLNRLKYCMDSLYIKPCIVYKNFLCIIDLVDSTDKNKSNTKYFKVNAPIEVFNPSCSRQFLLTCHIENFYENVNDISTELLRVKTHMNRIIETNYVKNFTDFNTIIEYNNKKESKINKVINYKNQIIEQIKKYEQVHTNIINNERHWLKKQYTLEKEISRIGDIDTFNATGYYKNEKLHSEIKLVNEKLDKIDIDKSDIILNIVKLTECQDALMLGLDKICFDNLVMINSINKNFDILENQMLNFEQIF